MNKLSKTLLAGVITVVLIPTSFAEVPLANNNSANMSYPLPILSKHKSIREELSNPAAEWDGCPWSSFPCGYWDD